MASVPEGLLAEKQAGFRAGRSTVEYPHPGQKATLVNLQETLLQKQDKLCHPVLKGSGKGGDSDKQKWMVSVRKGTDRGRTGWPMSRIKPAAYDRHRWQIMAALRLV